MTPEQEILVLLQHRDNVAESATYEEFKAHQVRFLDMLIESKEAKVKNDTAVWSYLEPPK